MPRRGIVRGPIGHAGHLQITSNAGPNTQISLDGLGTLWLHRVLPSDKGIEVRMIELLVQLPAMRLPRRPLIWQKTPRFRKAA